MNQSFDTTPRTVPAPKDVWAKFHEIFEVSESDLLSTSRFDRFRRVYRKSDVVLKVVVSDREESAILRVNTLKGEFDVISRCNDLDAVPKPLGYYKTQEFEILELEYRPGKSYADAIADGSGTLLVIGKLIKGLTQLSARGISHNDVLPENILIDNYGCITIIDFDQATTHNRTVAFIRSIFGVPVGGVPVHRSALGLSIRTMAARLAKYFPAPVRNRVKQFLKISGPSTLPHLPDNAEESAKLLRKAWRIAQKSSASSPGQQIAYYTFEYNGYIFPGERSWEDRWSYLRDATNYKGKRVLELGCNMALLSCHLLKDKGAQNALGVDIDFDILKSAALISEALEVQPRLERIDLDQDENWEELFHKFDPNVVFALNVLNWVNDKSRLLNYFGTVNELIFEGHDSVEVESQRLRAVGFDQIRLITTTERKRPVLHCRKSHLSTE